MHDAYIGGRSLNALCITISGGRTEQHVIIGFVELTAVD